jgi:caa(3)-type oxidase subunit IV
VSAFSSGYQLFNAMLSWRGSNVRGDVKSFMQIAFFDLGPLNVVAALTIAVFKAALVVLFFMHVKYSTRLTWAVVAGSIFWFGILLVLTLGDYLTRSWRTYG